MAKKPNKGRGRPKGAPKETLHVEVRSDLHAKLAAEIERQRRSKRTVVEDMIEKYLDAPDRPESETK